MTWICYKCGMRFIYRPPICICGYYLFFEERYITSDHSVPYGTEVNDE